MAMSSSAGERGRNERTERSRPRSQTVPSPPAEPQRAPLQLFRVDAVLEIPPVEVKPRPWLYVEWIHVQLRAQVDGPSRRGSGVESWHPIRSRTSQGLASGRRRRTLGTRTHVRWLHKATWSGSRAPGSARGRTEIHTEAMQCPNLP